MSNIKSPIAVKEFVRRLEEFSVDFYKNCLLKTNQFSTKYILQQMIKSQLDQKKEIHVAMQLLGDEQVDAGYLENILLDFSRKQIDGKFELESLNFVEATELAILLMDNVIDKYQILMSCKLSANTKRTLDEILMKKQNQLKALKKEYERRRYK